MASRGENGNPRGQAAGPRAGQGENSMHLYYVRYIFIGKV